MKHSKLALLTQGALIAALYTALTYLANALGLANGAVQVRFSEALTILPVFTPAAICRVPSVQPAHRRGDLGHPVREPCDAARRDRHLSAAQARKAGRGAAHLG